MNLLYSNLPSLDLHGIDREYARILINEFLNDNFKMRKKKLVIIHGNGAGIVRKTTQETLRQSKLVAAYKIDNFNSGMTLVELKENVDNLA